MNKRLLSRQRFYLNVTALCTYLGALVLVVLGVE